MSNKFKTTQITKAMVRDLDNVNQLHDISDLLLQKSPNIPHLLRDLIGPSIMEEFLQSDVWEHDTVERFVVLPTGKAYSERGQVFDERKTVKPHLFKVPSWGLQSHVRPSDVRRARKPGTKDQLEMIDDLVNEDIRQMREAFTLFEEVQLAHLIVNGTFYNVGSDVPAYDFYAEYGPAGMTAATRPNVAFDFSDSTAYPREVGEDARALINDNLLDGQSISGFVALCGRDFFKERIKHPKEEQAMVERSGIDGQDPLIKRLENFAQQYRMYRGADDILYIQYDAQVGGSPLIPVDEAYIMPVDLAEMFFRAYAPAETMEYVNQTALREYAWEDRNSFAGAKVWYESNFGTYLTAPLSIIKATMTPSA